jgi:hypothetical protein
MKRLMATLVFVIIVAEACSGPNAKSSAAKELKVRIKAGVIFKSGDVKPVARCNFIISKEDLVGLWVSSKKNQLLDQAIIEKDISVEIGYDAKMKTIQESIDNINRLISSLPRQLKEHVDKTYQQGQAYPVSWYFDEFRFEPVDLNEYTNRLEKQYVQIINFDLDAAAEKFFALRYEEFKKLKGTIGTKGKLNLDLGTLKKQQKELNELVTTKTLEKTEENLKKAEADFTLKLKDAYVSSFLTDLSGETTVTLPKGKYFIFGMAEIGANIITWNYTASISSDGQYIELSNDNAFSFKKEEVSQLLGFNTDSDKQ